MGAPRKYQDPKIGQQFGYGTVKALASFRRKLDRKNYERGAVLDCECGTEYLADLASLYTDGRKSCGCKRKKRGIVATPGYAQHPLYFTWHGMIDRCYNPEVKNYRLYGGRGIKVCDAWRGIEGMMNFVRYTEAELGPRPFRSTLDRKDPNGNYEPGNVRWATYKVQSANQRNYKVSQQEVRIWALNKGIPVNSKGNIAMEIIEAYWEEHGVQGTLF